MKVTLRELSELIRQELNERAPLKSKSKKSREADSLPYGKYLFGATRLKPSKNNYEKDTPEEDDLENELRRHYHGMGDALKPKILDTLLDLKNDGVYTDVLAPPGSATHAYRLMSNISLQTLANFIGYVPTNFDFEEVYHERGGIFIPERGGNKRHYSWSLNADVFKKILADWKSFTPASNKLTFIVVMRAPISGNKFLLNPNETYKFAKKYAYQQEVISIDAVKCDHIWYVPLQKRPWIKDRQIYYDPSYENEGARDRRVIKKLYNTNFG